MGPNYGNDNKGGWGYQLAAGVGVGNGRARFGPLLYRSGCYYKTTVTARLNTTADVSTSAWGVIWRGDVVIHGEKDAGTNRLQGGLWFLFPGITKVVLHEDGETSVIERANVDRRTGWGVQMGGRREWTRYRTWPFVEVYVNLKLGLEFEPTGPDPHDQWNLPGDRISVGVNCGLAIPWKAKPIDVARIE